MCCTMIKTKEDVEELSRQLMVSVEAVDDVKSVYESYFGRYRGSAGG